MTLVTVPFVGFSITRRAAEALATGPASSASGTAMIRLSRPVRPGPLGTSMPLRALHRDFACMNRPSRLDSIHSDATGPNPAPPAALRAAIIAAGDWNRKRIFGIRSPVRRTAGWGLARRRFGSAIRADCDDSCKRRTATCAQWTVRCNDRPRRQGPGTCDIALWQSRFCSRSPSRRPRSRPGR